MSPKSLNCFILFYFWNCPQFVVSHPMTLMENNFDVGQDLESREDRGEFLKVTEEPISLTTDSGFNAAHKNSICMDNFDIKPRTDGLPGSRTITEIPDFGGNSVLVQCSWPIAVALDSAIEIAIRIYQSDWDLPCTTWNLTLKYGFDPKTPGTRTTIVCPSQRRRTVKIPSEAKAAVLILEGLVSRTPGISLHWTYSNVSKPLDIDFHTRTRGLHKKTWGQLAIIIGSFAAVIVVFSCLCLYEVLKKIRRRGPPTDDEQIDTELQEFQLASAPPRSRPRTMERARAIQGQQVQLPLMSLPSPPTFLTFQLQLPAPLRERLF